MQELFSATSSSAKGKQELKKKAVVEMEEKHEINAENILRKVRVASAEVAELMKTWTYHNMVKVEMIAITDQSMTSFVEIENNKFLFSTVYGSNDGDFNVSIHPDESLNFYDGQSITMDMQDFIDYKTQIVVFDHAAVGILFIWSNKFQEGFLAKKLDHLPSEGNPMKILYSKLKRLKIELKKLNKAHFSDISSRINQKREELV
ncbi:hypothetical protein DITRI_Ditri08aG0066900 [Diplodiscus trichospermus]